jgi:hypothetical protein
LARGAMGYSKNTRQTTGKNTIGCPGLKYGGREIAETALTAERAPFHARPATFWTPQPRPIARSRGTSLPITRCSNWRCRRIRRHHRHLTEEVPMATQRHGQIIETPTEARQAEPGPSVLALLTVSTGLAVLILGIVWFVFFRT